MNKFLKYYFYILDVKLKSNTFVIILISFIIVFVSTVLPKKSELAYSNNTNYSSNIDISRN